MADLEKSIEPVVQKILESPVVEIVVIARPESDLLAHYGPALG